MAGEKGRRQDRRVAVPVPLHNLRGNTQKVRGQGRELKRAWFSGLHHVHRN